MQVRLLLKSHFKGCSKRFYPFLKNCSVAENLCFELTALCLCAAANVDMSSNDAGMHMSDLGLKASRVTLRN